MSHKTLIIFTRYPEKGKTKTRLIPAVGAEKAAIIQKLMTENTLKKTEKLDSNIKVKIYYAGGNQTLMENWLGKPWEFTPQAKGDLGEKMFSAIESTYNITRMPVIVIGIDCQSLTADILTKAFNAIDNYDLVLGEAEDGGYYLIGLKSPVKELFKNINWGTNTVYKDTLNIAKNHKLSIFDLPTLTDIDRPEDLVNLPDNIKNILTKN
ncbi:MAG: TIGR04282 family arsenosugar biosynthesis glycosyltransferase [Cyanobacterium sp.]